MFQSSAIDGIQLFWMDQSKARAQAQCGTNPGHHFGREVGTFLLFCFFPDFQYNRIYFGLAAESNLLTGVLHELHPSKYFLSISVQLSTSTCSMRAKLIFMPAFDSLTSLIFRISIICLGSINLVECRPGPIFGLEATEISKDGILLSWLPGSREVEQYRLTITSECTNWMIPECENTARRIRRGVDDEYYNTVEDDEVMKLLEVSDDDTELMGDYQIGDNDMEKDKEDTMLPNGDCKVRMFSKLHSLVLMKIISGS